MLLAIVFLAVNLLLYSRFSLSSPSCGGEGQQHQPYHPQPHTYRVLCFSQPLLLAPCAGLMNGGCTLMVQAFPCWVLICLLAVSLENCKSLWHFMAVGSLGFKSGQLQEWLQGKA